MASESSRCVPSEYPVRNSRSLDGQLLRGARAVSIDTYFSNDELFPVYIAIVVSFVPGWSQAPVSDSRDRSRTPSRSLPSQSAPIQRNTIQLRKTKGNANLGSNPELARKDSHTDLTKGKHLVELILMDVLKK